VEAPVSPEPVDPLPAILATLNPAQRRAAAAGDGPLLIIAVLGRGRRRRWPTGWRR